MNWKSKLILGVLTALAMMGLTYLLPRGSVTQNAALVQFSGNSGSVGDLRFTLCKAKVAVLRGLEPYPVT
jgi:hypothetical protein